MKRKISMLLALTLVATSFIACDETAQLVETPTQTPTQTQPSEPIVPDVVQPADVEDSFDDEIIVPVSVILEGEHYIEDTDNVNQFLSIIENATFTEEILVNPAGSFVFEFYVVFSDDSIREFEMNSGYLFEHVEGEMLRYALSDIEDYNFVVSLMDIDTPVEDNTETQVDDNTETQVEDNTEAMDSADFEIVYAPTMSFEDAPFNSLSPDDVYNGDIASSYTENELPELSTPPSTPAPSVGSAGQRLTDEHDAFAVLLDDTIWIDDLEGVNKFMDIIANTTIYEEMPISAGGSRTFNFTLMLVDVNCREFSANGTYLTETVDGRSVYRVFNNPDDFIYLLNLVDGE